MVAEKKLETLENSSVRLTITVAQDDVKKEYADIVATHSKTAQIKGFRKGKVPAEIMERKFGDALRYEAIQKILDTSLREAFDAIEEKPLPYSQPALDGELDFDIEKDLTFSVMYDVFPKIELGPTTGLTVEEPQVEVTDDDIAHELKTLQEQNSIVEEKEGGTVEKDDIVTVDYWEIGDDGVVADSKREDFVFTVGSGYNLYKFDDDVLGMKDGEEKTIEKEFPEDFENEELAGKKKKIAVAVKAIKTRKLPEIDDELAQDISDKYDTLDDLKEDIKRRLESTVESRVRETKVEALTEQLVESAKIDVPASMMEAELDMAWRNFVSQFRVSEQQVSQMLSAQGRTRDDLIEEWKPQAEKRLRGRLIVQKLIEDEKIEVTDEELDAELKRIAEDASTSIDELREYYEKNNALEYVRNELRERRLFDALFERNTVKPGEKVKLLDLLQRNR